MKILWNYQAYEMPKKALFKIHKNTYDINNGGWQYDEKEYLIIGFSDPHYIYRLQETTTDDTKENVLMPIGIHSDYFIKWIPTQLELF